MGSTAQSIATGSQDFAALAGLFCTDGVERNLLAAQYGYASVAASSLSILGLLGLVKSTVKVAMGLEKCVTAGFTVDSLRGRFGFLLDETAPIDLVECDVVEVSLWDKFYHIKKSKQYLQKERNPIVAVGSDWPGGLHGITAVNLGNARRERAFIRHPLVIATLALFCSGATAWLLLIVSTERTWVTSVAVPGLHASLLLMLAIPLLHDHQTNRPARHISAAKYKALFTGVNDNATRLRFLQSRVNGGDVLHFRGSTALVDPGFMPVPAIIVSAFCAVAYICQYAVLKKASSTRAFLWIGAQATLALIRVGLWAWNPSFDDPRTEQTEFALVKNDASESITFAELVCASSSTEFKLKEKFWKFLASNDTYNILRHALEFEWEHSFTPVETIPLLFMDLGRILRNRVSSEEEKKELDAILNGLPLRIGLYINNKNHVRPFVMTETSYTLVPSEYSHALTTRWCWVQVTREEETFGFSPCRGFAVKEDGDQVHLRGPSDCHRQCMHDADSIPGLTSCSRGCPFKKSSQNHLDQDDLKGFSDKMRRIARLQAYLVKKKSSPSLTGRPDVYLTATPGTTTRKGLYCDPAHRHGGTLSDKGFDFVSGLASIANYIDHGFAEQQREKLSFKDIGLESWNSFTGSLRLPNTVLKEHLRDRSASSLDSSLWKAEISSIAKPSTSISPGLRTASPFHFV
ncbi:hypothetical protein BU16DRAFT_562066 [Lophium mytilinum]|uniref:Uncharacterized protein n=1 Tax=Lophium mytilinum TaxID=390894 RepID=A0A6A6QU20_9PEZI|nr:hypothetical protein BU16DRAFT_562066 [Lophium mytilinum]